MSRRRTAERIERLIRQRDEAHEDAATARDRAAVLTGRLAGERATAQTIAAQLAARASDVGAQLGRIEAGSERARRDVLTMRQLVAGHVVSIRAGADGELAARGLLDQLMVRGVDLGPELARAGAEAAAAGAAGDAASAGSESAAAVTQEMARP